MKNKIAIELDNKQLKTTEIEVPFRCAILFCGDFPAHINQWYIYQATNNSCFSCKIDKKGVLHIKGFGKIVVEN